MTKIVRRWTATLGIFVVLISASSAQDHVISTEAGRVQVIGDTCGVIMNGEESTFTGEVCASISIVAERIRQLDLEIDTLREQLAAERDEMVAILAETVVTLAATVSVVSELQLEVSETTTAAETVQQSLEEQTQQISTFLQDLITQYQALNARLDASVPNFRQ